MFYEYIYIIMECMYMAISYTYNMMKYIFMTISNIYNIIEYICITIFIITSIYYIKILALYILENIYYLSLKLVNYKYENIEIDNTSYLLEENLSKIHNDINNINKKINKIKNNIDTLKFNIEMDIEYIKRDGINNKEYVEYNTYKRDLFTINDKITMLNKLYDELKENAILYDKM